MYAGVFQGYDHLRENGASKKYAERTLHQLETVSVSEHDRSPLFGNLT